MKALILAGGQINPEDPLWEESKGLPKAMINILGKPMVQWILDEVNQVDEIDLVYVAGLDQGAALRSQKPVTYYPDRGGVIENLLQGVEMMLQDDPETTYFLCISSDIPLVTGKIMQAVIHGMQPGGFNLYYNVIEKKRMEASYPGVKRTYIRFGNGRFCGGDMHVFNARTFAEPSLYKFVKHRKNPIKLISLIGFDTLIRALIFPPDLEKGGAIIRRRTRISVYPLDCPYPELGVDVDTPAHLAMVRQLLEAKLKHQNRRDEGSISAP